MNHKERLTKVLSGQIPDKIPWVPKLSLWYNYHKRNESLPSRFTGKDLHKIREELGMGNPARMEDEGCSILEINLSNKVEIVKQSINQEIITRYNTPLGSVSTKEKASQKEYIPQPTEYMIKSREDYEILEYILENLEYKPTYEKYKTFSRKVGDSGLPVVTVGLWPPGGVGAHCPVHTIFRHLLGYRKGYVDLLSKYPSKVQRLINILDEKANDMLQIVKKSPAQLILHGSHFDGAMTPPPIFRKYFLPYFKNFSNEIRSEGKLLACHLDADTYGLFDLIKKAGFDVADCFATKPLVQETTLGEAKEKWENEIVIWGGIPSTILEPSYSKAKFREYMRELFKVISPGKNFILGISDNLMPGCDFGRVVEVSKMVESLGTYPVDKGEVEEYFKNFS